MTANGFNQKAPENCHKEAVISLSPTRHFVFNMNIILTDNKRNAQLTPLKLINRSSLSFLNFPVTFKICQIHWKVIILLSLGRSHKTESKQMSALKFCWLQTHVNDLINASHKNKNKKQFTLDLVYTWNKLQLCWLLTPSEPTGKNKTFIWTFLRPACDPEILAIHTWLVLSCWKEKTCRLYLFLHVASIESLN